MHKKPSSAYRWAITRRAVLARLFVSILSLLWCSSLCWGQVPAAPSDAVKAVGLQEVLAAVPADLRTPGRWALVIGAGTYEDPRIPPLPACVNDARALAAVLTDPAIGMFPPDHVTLLIEEQVTRQKVVEALDRLGREAGPLDLVLVFFSGHGATDEKGRSYWVMSSTVADQLRATALPEMDVSELLGEIKTTRLVTLIDACYSASTANLGQTKSLQDLSGIYPEFKGDGRVAITASKGDQLSVVIRDEKSPGHGYSAFAWHAIEGLRGQADADADGVVTVDELWTHVKDRTERTARREGGNQQPQLKGQLGSKFLLSVNAQRLRRRQQESAEARTLREGRLATLKQLAISGKLTPEQYQTGETLLAAAGDAPGEELDEFDRRWLAEYLSVLEGRLPPEKLQVALDLIETPSQRQERLTRRAEEAGRRAAGGGQSQRLEGVGPRGDGDAR